MRIRIVTRHPALQHVLRRTAPVGILLTCAVLQGQATRPECYSIEVSVIRRDDKKHSVLGVWLPPHVQHYGVDRFEIDGRVISTETETMRRALAAGDRAETPVWSV